jgi:hypothetical protein
VFEAEACWLRHALDGFATERLPPALNLGSSSAVVREAVQPWVDNEVFSPLRGRGVEVIHVDMRELPGVDVRADLTDPCDVRRVRAYRPNALLCCNLLEHVLDPERLARHCLDLLPTGGLAFVTVPYSYPFHRDPIERCIGRALTSLPRYSPVPISAMVRSLVPGCRIATRYGNALDPVAPCLALSRTVRVFGTMEALNDAAVLASRRVSDHLHGVREAIISA